MSDLHIKEVLNLTFEIDAKLNRIKWSYWEQDMTYSKLHELACQVHKDSCRLKKIIGRKVNDGR